MVKIDMEMPKSCMYCRFVNIYHEPVAHKAYYWCPAMGQEVNGKRKRDKDCPLQEVRE